MDRNLKSYAFIKISNWVRQTALVCEYICFRLASVIWGVCVLSCSVVSDSVTPLTFGDVTSNQITGTRFIGTAFSFMPLFLSNRTVQAKCHGQHRDSKTLKSASRPLRSTECPWGSQWGSLDQYLPCLQAWKTSHHQGQPCFLGWWIGGSMSLPYGAHPSKASSERCLPPVVSSSWNIPFLRTAVPGKRKRQEALDFSHKQQYCQPTLQEIPFPDLNMTFPFPYRINKKLYFSTIFSYADHVHNGFDYIVM